MRYQFEVDLKEDSLEISSIDDNFETFTIDVDEFWNFILEYGLNEYCYDYYSPQEHDGHGQDSGCYEMEEYFEILSYETIKKDLDKFISKTKYKDYIYGV